MKIVKTSEKLKGNICYFQSGGPTAVINSSYKGLLDAYKKLNSKKKFYVSQYGIDGLIKGKLLDVSDFDDSKLNTRPGSTCGSLRLKLKKDDPNLDKIIKTIMKFDIRYLFANGGNDSMDTCYKLSLLMKEKGYDCIVIGIPKTVDNDLPITDHTPGYGSAAKYIANTIIEIAVDDLTYQKGRINIVECMGRDSGYLTASSSLASLRGVKPDYIYVPEVAFDLDKEVKKWEATYDKKGRCLVVVSEGIRDAKGSLISASKVADSFGNVQMGGVANYLSSIVTKDGYKSRGIELSIPQRAGSILLSKTDVKEAMEVGKYALTYALKGIDGVMVTIKRDSNSPYTISYGTCNLEEVGGKVTALPVKYINKNQDNITPSFIDYVKPLIQGEIVSMDEDGLLIL